MIDYLNPCHLYLLLFVIQDTIECCACIFVCNCKYSFKRQGCVFVICGVHLYAWRISNVILGNYRLYAGKKEKEKKKSTIEMHMHRISNICNNNLVMEEIWACGMEIVETNNISVWHFSFYVQVFKTLLFSAFFHFLKIFNV